MYTTVTARRVARPGNAALCGHIYDICEAGVRIELDEPLEPGESVELELELPGAPGGVEASADVVWIHDALDDPGPRRMALRFTGFAGRGDRDRLTRYLTTSPSRRAA